jgi:putative transposase
MTPNQSIAMIKDIGKLLYKTDGDLLRASLEKIYNLLMELEVETKTGAEKYQRSDSRINYRNGTRKRPLETSLGPIQLDIPKLRRGSYMPSFVEPRRLTEKALVAVIQDAYINGVSTRKVDNLVEGLGLNIDKSKVSRLCKCISDTVEKFRNRSLESKEYPYLYLDATFPKVREGGQVQSMSLVIAVAVNRNGDREVLGFDIGTREDGPFWTTFLESLVSRGLKGVKLIISDAHTGLKEAISRVFTGIPWQRCRVHFMRNVLSQVPKKYQGMASAMVRTIFTADNLEEAKAQLRLVVDQLSGRFPKAIEVLINAEDEVLTYMGFPQKHWKQIYSSNVLERLNKEIKRRFNVVSVFPDRASVIRLGGAVLMEQHDEWLAADKRYLSKESMDLLYIKPLKSSSGLLIASGS